MPQKLPIVLSQEEVARLIDAEPNRHYRVFLVLLYVWKGVYDLLTLAHPVAMGVLLALQCFVVIFVSLHNWIPLGSLNNVRGVRVAFPTSKLLVTTLINLAPFAVGLAATVYFFGGVYPGWVSWWLWITYGLACYGSLKAWWLPYLFRPDPALIARYRTMYAGTHSFLPEHNGIRPDTLHIIFDIVTVVILIDLALLTA